MKFLRAKVRTISGREMVKILREADHKERSRTVPSRVEKLLMRLIEGFTKTPDAAS